MMIPGNIDLTVKRGLGASSTQHHERVLDSGKYLSLEISADIEEGDIAEYTLPNGKLKTVRVTKVEHFQSPFPNSSHMDNIKATYVAATENVINRPHPVELPGLHGEISRVSGTKWAQGHTDAAVFDAFKLIENRVQKLTGSTLSGTNLMENIFANGTLDITSVNSTGQTEEDERKGFKNLFAGATLGIRNPRGHGEDLDTDQDEAIEMLAFASLLMRRLDLAQQRLENP